MKKDSGICVHNPLKYDGRITRMFRFLWLGKRALNNCQCEACGVALELPIVDSWIKIGACVLAMLTFYGISSAVQTITFFQQSSPLFGVILICVADSIICRIAMSVSFAYGKWKVSSERSIAERNRVFRERKKTIWITMIISMGICALCLYGEYITIAVVLLAIVVIIFCITERKYRGISIGVVAMVYSIISVVFGGSFREIFVIIDSVVLIMVTFAWIVFVIK